ncbi:MAG: glycosyltransferase [Candidatus Omnitrophica bacterium]|nr:glycosyltransferase [Candidatus Omnitrophota bacterium]
MKKLGIICSQFPEMHETFIIRELLALKRARIDFKIYSLKSCKDPVRHDYASPLMSQVSYVSWDSPGTWIQGAWQLLTHPAFAVKAFFWICRSHRQSGLALLKGWVVWMQSMVLAEKMKRDGIGHIHAHWATYPTSAAFIVSRRHNIPYSFTAHAFDIFVNNPSLKEKIGSAVKVITCTDYNRRYLAQLCPGDKDKVVLNYHGVDIATFQYVDDKSQEAECNEKTVKPLLLTVGRFSESKGYPVLLRSYKGLRDTGVDFRAIIVGQGKLEKQVMRLIREYGLEKVVEVRPTVPQTELRKLYKKAYAFVLPCVIANDGDRDGIPNVILEAMAMGLPVVSTSISGVPEAVLPGKTGILAESGNAAELTAVLRQLIEDKAFANDLGQQGRTYALEMFPQERHMDNLTHTMQSILSAKGQNRRGDGSKRARVSILFIIDKLTAAGTQTNLLEIIRHLDQDRFLPYLVTLSSGGELVDEFKAAGVVPIELEVGNAYGPSGWRAIGFLNRFIREKRIDIVQTHFLQADLIGITAAKLGGAKKIITTRRDEGFWRNARQLLLNRFLNPFCDEILVNSEAVRRACLRDEKIDVGKTRSIYNGVNVAVFKPSRPQRDGLRKELNIDREDIVIGTVANMRYAVKGHVYLLDAIPDLLRVNTRLKFILAGDGPLRPVLEEHAEKLGIRESVLFLGSRRDTVAIYNAMDIYCLPSISEGFSNTILEAMACGKPVVACHVGGNPEIVTDKITGILVNPNDSDALSMGLERLIREVNTRIVIGEKSRQRVVADFSSKKMISDYESYYLKLMGEKDAAQDPDALLCRKSVKKICHLIWSLDAGGAEKQVIRIAKWQRENGDLPMAVCFQKKGLLSNELEQAGIPVFVIPKRLGVDLSFIKRLARFLKKEDVGILHMHLPTASLWGRIAAIQAGINMTFVSEHSDMSCRRLRYRLANRLLGKWTKRYFVVSDHIRKLMLRAGIDAAKIEVIRNGIELNGVWDKTNYLAVRYELGLSEKVRIIGTVGRMEERKDYINFLQAGVLIKKEYPDTHFMMVGDGPLRQKIENEAKRLGLFGNVSFLGTRQDVPRLLQAMDVFVLSSLTEGVSLALLEAMSVSRPCVVTDVGGNPEVIQDQENGLLVPVKDSRALARAVLSLLSDSLRTNQIGSAARRTVEEKFTTQAMMKQYTRHYNRDCADALKKEPCGCPKCS